MRLRMLLAASAAVLVAGGLAGCKSNVGVAARVGGHEISETQVNDSVTRAGIDPADVAKANAAGQDLISPKVQALQILISEQVFEDTLRAHRLLPSDDALRGSHDDAVSALNQGQGATPLVGAAYDRSLLPKLKSAGLSTGVLAHFLRLQELQYALIKRLRIGSNAAFLASTSKAAHTVTISPRYGTWDPGQLTVNGKGGTPDYLHLQPTPGSAAQNPLTTTP